MFVRKKLFLRYGYFCRFSRYPGGVSADFVPDEAVVAVVAGVKGAPCGDWWL